MSSWRKARVGALLCVLFLIASWAGGVHRTRRARLSWDRPLGVAVVLLSPANPDPLAVARIRESLGDLEDRLAGEFARYRGGGPPPFAFTLLGPVSFGGPLPLAPESRGLLDRLEHAFRLRRTLRGIHAAAAFDPGVYDVRIYLLLEPGSPQDAGRRTFAEGAGEAGGDVGLVRAAADPDDPTLALVAAAHELLHCLGATDKYDDAGHALVPAGLAEPALQPLYPQRYAEWMVGEVPLGPGRGRLPSSLAEVRVGPATAQEIGWADASTPPG